MAIQCSQLGYLLSKLTDDERAELPEVFTHQEIRQKIDLNNIPSQNRFAILSEDDEGDINVKNCKRIVKEVREILSNRSRRDKGVPYPQMASGKIKKVRDPNHPSQFSKNWRKRKGSESDDWRLRNHSPHRA